MSAATSAYENQAGLRQGDAQAIGNVTADATIGAAGALAGSVVPGLGTAVGFVVGVGVAITYGGQLSGVRDAMANRTAAAVDGAKNLASGAWGGLKGLFAEARSTHHTGP